MKFVNLVSKVYIKIMSVWYGSGLVVILVIFNKL